MLVIFQNWLFDTGSPIFRQNGLVEIKLRSLSKRSMTLWYHPIMTHLEISTR